MPPTCTGRDISTQYNNSPIDFFTLRHAVFCSTGCHSLTVSSFVPIWLHMLIGLWDVHWAGFGIWAYMGHFDKLREPGIVQAGRGAVFTGPARVAAPFPCSSDRSVFGTDGQRSRNKSISNNGARALQRLWAAAKATKRHHPNCTAAFWGGGGRGTMPHHYCTQLQFSAVDIGSMGVSQRTEHFRKVNDAFFHRLLFSEMPFAAIICIASGALTAPFRAC